MKMEVKKQYTVYYYEIIIIKNNVFIYLGYKINKSITLKNLF